MNKFLIELNKYVQDDDMPVVRGLISEAIEEIIGEDEAVIMQNYANNLRAEQRQRAKEFLGNDPN